jgi:hypothetical protein
MKSELEAAYFGLMTRSVIDGQPGLQTTWSSANQGSATTIRTGDSHTRQVSLAFDLKRPLWVVSKDRSPPLRDVPDPSGYVDLWSGTLDLPKYAAPVDRPMRTSIMLPLVRVGRPLGVLYLESTAHVEATLIAQQELEMLAEACTAGGMLSCVHKSRVLPRLGGLRHVGTLALRSARRRGQAPKEHGSHLILAVG